MGYDPTNGECRLADTGARVSSHSHMAISRIIEIGCVCNNTQIINGTVLGQPTEGALMVLALKVAIIVNLAIFYCIRIIDSIGYFSELLSSNKGSPLHIGDQMDGCTNRTGEQG